MGVGAEVPLREEATNMTNTQDGAWVRCKDGVTRAGKLFINQGNGKAVVISTTPDGTKLFHHGTVVRWVGADGVVRVPLPPSFDDDDGFAETQRAEMEAENAAADALYGFTD